MQRIGVTLGAGLAIGVLVSASVTHYGDNSVAAALMLPVILGALLFFQRGRVASHRPLRRGGGRRASGLRRQQQPLVGREPGCRAAVARNSGAEGFAFDSYGTFPQLCGQIVLGLENHYVELGSRPAELVRGPQPGEATADNAHVSTTAPVQGRAPLEGAELVEPERRRSLRC